MIKKKIDFLRGNFSIDITLSSSQFYFINPRTGQLNQFTIALPSNPETGDWFRFTAINDGTELHPTTSPSFISTVWTIRAPTHSIEMRAKDIHTTSNTPLTDGVVFTNGLTKRGDYAEFIFVKGYWVVTADTANGLNFQKHAA